MNLVRAKYQTERGIRRGDKTHVSNQGLPLCGVKYRNQRFIAGHPDSAITQWIPELGEPTCPVCTARVKKLGGVA